MKSRSGSVSSQRAHSVISSRYAVRCCDVVGKSPTNSMEWRECMFVMLDSFENDIGLLFENIDAFLQLAGKSASYPLTGIEKSMCSCMVRLLQSSKLFGGCRNAPSYLQFRSQPSSALGSVHATPVKPLTAEHGAPAPTAPVDFSTNFESNQDLMSDVLRLTQSLEESQRESEKFKAVYLKEKTRIRELEAEVLRLKEQNDRLSPSVPDVVSGDDIVLLTQLMAERDRLVEENRSLVAQLGQGESPASESLLLLYEENFMLQRFLCFEQDEHKITQAECRRLKEGMEKLQLRLRRPADKG